MTKRGLIIVLLLSIVILLSGCITSSPPEEEGGESSETAATAIDLPSQYHYAIEFSSDEGNGIDQMEVWVEDDKERVDIRSADGITTILTLSDSMCLYDASSDSAMKFSIEEGQGANPGATYARWFGSYYYGNGVTDDEIVAAIQHACGFDESCSVKKVGYETIAGHRCVVIETTYAEGGETGISSVKMWFASGYGYLMKLETRDASGAVTTMEFTEIEIGEDIPDDVFSIPACENADDVFAGLEDGMESFEYPG